MFASVMLSMLYVIYFLNNKRRVLFFFLSHWSCGLELFMPMVSRNYKQAALSFSLERAGELPIIPLGKKQMCC